MRKSKEYEKDYVYEPDEVYGLKDCKRDSESTTNLAQQINNLMTNARQLTDSVTQFNISFKDVANTYYECKRVKEQTKQVEAWSRAEIVKTVAKFKICEKVFRERDKALSKHYEVLDKAIASNDRGLIIAAMSEISSIVTKSPLEEFKEFVELFNDTSRPMLDLGSPN